MRESISRRQFLKGAAMTGAMIGFPIIVPAEVVARKGAKRVMPNDRVNVGQIGCGNIGSNYHIPILSKEADVRIIAVADAYKSRRDAAANFL
jgi:hypothetical protein